MRSVNRIVIVQVAQIRRLEAEDNYVRIWTDRPYLHKETLTGLMEKLDPAEFLRVHRSHAVNIRVVRELRPQVHGEYVLTLDDGTELTSGRSFRGRIQQAFGLGRAQNDAGLGAGTQRASAARAAAHAGARAPAADRGPRLRYPPTASGSDTSSTVSRGSIRARSRAASRWRIVRAAHRSCTGTAPSWRSSAALTPTPPGWLPRPPDAAMTRWHGTRIGTGLDARHTPTARCARGMPMRSASAAYVVTSPAGTSRTMSHTRRCIGVAGAATGSAASASAPTGEVVAKAAGDVERVAGIEAEERSERPAQPRLEALGAVVEDERADALREARHVHDAERRSVRA